MNRTFALTILSSFFASVLGATTQRLPFINDDFTKALTEAKQRHVPVFVEVWAPW